MNLDTLFSIANAVVFIGWLLLIFAPKSRATQWLMATYAIQLALGIAYAALMALHFGRTPGGYMTLDQVSQLFQSRPILLAGWLHYGAFDLFVGFWEVQDARQRDIRHAFVIPCLLLTFLFGPAGLLAYLILRCLRRVNAATSNLNA